MALVDRFRVKTEVASRFFALRRTITYNSCPTMPKHSSSILELARRGAEARSAELQAELADLRRAFPNLGGGRSRKPKATTGRASGSKTGSGGNVASQSHRRRKMSPAARRAVSVRM